MNKKCAKCSKTVYPIEEWKCLDKLWHKQCFKCQVCSMTLNMRNYKGFDKQPYCEAHIPKAKATTVAETPELKRIAENTRLQSNVKYHAEFEKTKGKLTQVADDPETLRIKQNSRIISNVAYHGDLKKKADMEQRRVLTSENDQLTGERNQVNAQLDEITTQLEKTPMIDTCYSGPAVSNSPYSSRQSSTLIYSSNKGAVNVSVGNSVGSIADLDPVNNFYGSVAGNPYPQSAPARSANSRMMPQYGKTNVYKAMYDYDAQEQDEVSFVDGDIIIDCVHIHEGWMSGVVQRTGQSGLLPANYVQSVVF